MPTYQIYGCGFNAHGQLMLSESPAGELNANNPQVSKFAPLSRPSLIVPRLVFAGWSRTASKPLPPGQGLQPLKSCGSKF